MLMASSVEKVLLVANSSVNFVYYCLVGKTFRQHMVRSLFPSCCSRWLESMDLLGTTTAGTGETTVGGGAAGAGGLAGGMDKDAAAR